MRVYCRKKLLICLFLGLILYIPICLYSQLTLEPSEEDDFNIQQRPTTRNGKTENVASAAGNSPHHQQPDQRSQKQFHRPPVLLWWTYEGGRTDGEIDCDGLKCFSTIDRSYRDHGDTKVFLFYGTGVELYDMPLPRKNNELWFLKHEESPKNNEYLFSHEEIMTLFNFTSTFKRQSNYPIQTQWLPSLSYLQSKKFLMSTKTKNNLKIKENLAPVLYVQSDCGPPSDRDSYVRMLQNYIRVDSYGRCLHNRDLSEHLQFKTSVAGMHHDDFFRLVAKYKFTIAMENAICDDYITEKVWRPLHVGSVPIVFSSPKIMDFLPTNKSAVLVDDFDRVEDLAHFIKQLDEDDSEYDKYLSFKEPDGIANAYLVAHMYNRDWGHYERGRRKKYGNHFNGFLCRACKMAHNHLSNIENNIPPEKSVATLDHYGCPKPKRFDSNGKYVVEEKLLEEPYLYSKYMAKAFRNSYDKNVTLKEKYLKQQARYLRFQSGE